MCVQEDEPVIAQLNRQVAIPGVVVADYQIVGKSFFEKLRSLEFVIPVMALTGVILALFVMNRRAVPSSQTRSTRKPFEEGPQVCAP